MSLFESNAIVAVAVSGGPDSMALLHLLGSVSKNIVAVTVDHGLREESAAEARAAAAWCKKNKIEHHILHWRGEKPKSALHETARAARYELLEDFCRERRILHLATAHHADDNAETILQRIAKASGAAGLAGMHEHTFTPHLHVWRPLLRHTKADLVAYCEFYKIPFVQDPSNENEKFARGRLRGAAAVLAAEGLTAQNLNLLAKKQHEIVRLLENETAKFLANSARIIPAERAEILLEDFQGAIPAVQQAAMAYLLKTISGADAPVRYESLKNLCAALAAPGFRAKTLGHCRIGIQKKGHWNFIRVTPE